MEQVLYMPEPAGICPRACRKMGSTRLRVCPVEMQQVTGKRSPEISTRSGGGHGRGRRVACIVTLGGDGTNRAVFKATSGSPGPVCCPLSTGTNNVFSEFQEAAPPRALPPDCWQRVGCNRNVACTQSKVLCAARTLRALWTWPWESTWPSPPAPSSEPGRHLGGGSPEGALPDACPALERSAFRPSGGSWKR